MIFKSSIQSAIMAASHPDVIVRDIAVADGVMTVELEGEILCHSVTALQEFLFEQFSHKMPRALLLDFSRVQFLDSQGLAFLITLYKFCYPQNCPMTIRGANEHVQMLLKLTRMDAFIQTA